MHGFRAEHSAKFRALLLDGTSYRLITWILSAFLGRQVLRVQTRRCANKKNEAGFVVIASTRDFQVLFLFDVPGLVRWRMSGVWSETTETYLVQKYQDWIEGCMTSR